MMRRTIDVSTEKSIPNSKVVISRGEASEKVMIGGEAKEKEEVNLTVPGARIVKFDNSIMHKESRVSIDTSLIPEEAKLSKEDDTKIEELLVSNLNKCESSSRILFKLGKSTYVTSFTPDSDGKTRVPTMDGTITCDKDAHVFIYQVEDCSQKAKDIKSAIKDPIHNLTVLQTARIR